MYERLAVSNAIVECADVHKSFPSTYGLAQWLRYMGKSPRRPALSGVSLQVSPRQLFGLLGPNGAGKTTLLKLIATLSLPDSGRIVVDGIDAARSPDAVKRRIGLCTSEERSFYFRLTAHENLQFFGTLAGLGGGELEQRIAQVVELVDLTAAMTKRFDAFSSGMRQRLALARALIADPEILLLDEPTRGVDPVHADAMRRLLREELVGRRGKTIILTTNILEEAWSVCDTVAILNAGTIVAQGSPAELNATIGGRMRYAVSLDRFDEGLLARLRRIEGVLQVQAAPSGDQTLTIELVAGGRALTQLLHELSSNGTTIRGLRPLDDGLLELFRLTTQERER
jgi:ABC-2 type transport system ATP-binding protein